MPPISIRVRASTQAGRFRHGPLQLTDRWASVDLARPDVRDALVAHVGVQVAIHPNDRAAIEQAGFRFDGGRMVARTPAAAAPPAATTTAPSSTAPTGSSGPAAPPARARGARRTATA